MNKYISKGLGLIILSVVLMTTLLSCTKVEKKNNFKKELEVIDIDTSLTEMKNSISQVAYNIQAEQDYFKDKASEISYDEFASGLELSFEQLDVSFGKSHSIVISGIEELKANYSDKDAVNKILLIEEEQSKLSALFQDLYKYHYMILETDIILSLFSVELTSLMTYIADGNMTTIEYNTDLENIMTKYSELLVIENEAIFDDQFLNDQEQIEDTLRSLRLAKDEILSITTNTNIDEQVNKQVFNLFILIEKSILTVDDYTKIINKEVYINDNSLRIDDGALNYVNEILLGFKTEFN
jgi:hypothetical protein